MSKKKKNQNLVTVLIVSAVLHIIVFMILGSVVIFRAVIQSEPEFEAPEIPIAIEPEQLQVKSDMRKRTQDSGMTRIQPQQRITISNPQLVQVQAISPTVAPPTIGVSLQGVGTGTSGSGSGLGALGGTGGIGVGMRSISFLGLQSGGERVAILIDCSNHMLLDEKGGLHAFRLVKQECLNVIEALDPGVVFNVYLFSGNATVNRFKPHMVSVSKSTLAEVESWLAPINENVRALGAGKNNFEPTREYFKGGGGYTFANFARALHASFEDQAEAVFMITATWANIRKHLDDFAGSDRVREERDLERRIKEWERRDKANREKWMEEVYRPARAMAEKIQATENAKRRAAGKPDQVVLHIDYVIREKNLYDRVIKEKGLAWKRPFPPHRPVLPYYTPREVVDKLRRELYKDFYLDKQKDRPSVNIILFGRDDQAETSLRSLASSSRSGNFRIIQSLAELESAKSQSDEHRRKRAGN